MALMNNTMRVLFAIILAATTFAIGCGGGNEAITAPSEELQPSGETADPAQEPTLDEEGP